MLENESELLGSVGAIMQSKIDPESRKIYLTGPITVESASDFIIGLDVLSKLKERITIFLCSEGGEESAGYAIYDAICNCPAYTVIEGYGSVQSIAAMIIQAGNERWMAPHARFMIHNGIVEFSNPINLSALRAMSHETEKTTKNYYHILSKRSGMPMDRIKDLADAETYCSAQEALKYNFIDGVLKYRSKK